MSKKSDGEIEEDASGSEVIVESIRSNESPVKPLESRENSTKRKRQPAMKSLTAEDLKSVELMARWLGNKKGGAHFINQSKDGDNIIASVVLSEKQKNILKKQENLIQQAIRDQTQELEKLKKEENKLNAAFMRAAEAQSNAYNRLASITTIGQNIPKNPSSAQKAQRPPLTKTLDLPPECRLLFLSCWSFLQFFGELLGLAPFKCDALTNALNHFAGPTVLLTEINMSLLRLLIKKNRFDRDVSRASVYDDNSDEASSPSSTQSCHVEIPYSAFYQKNGNNEKLITPLTWETRLRAIAPYLSAYERLVEEASTNAHSSDCSRQLNNWQKAVKMLGEKNYWELSVAHKVYLIEMLVNSACEHQEVAKLISGNMAGRHMLESKRREEMMLISRSIREDYATKREQFIQNYAAAEAEKKNCSKDSPDKQNGGENVGPPRPSQIQIGKGIEELMIMDQLGGPFVYRDVMKEENFLAAEENAEAISSSNEDNADESSTDVDRSDLSRAEVIALIREREIERANRRRDRTIQNGRKNWLKTLEESTKNEDISALKWVIGKGRTLGFEGGSGSMRWASPQIAKAYLTLRDLKRRREKAEIASRYKKLLGEKFVRAEPVGTDSSGNRFWLFDHEEERLYIEIMKRREKAPPMKGPITSITLEEAKSIHQDISDSAKLALRVAVQDKLFDENTPLYDFKDTDPSYYTSELYYYDSQEELRNLILSLDLEDHTEKVLHEALQERFDLAELERSIAALAAEKETKLKEEFEWKVAGSDHIGRKICRKFKYGIMTGTITGWIPSEENEGLALWHVQHDDGDEEDLEDFEVTDAIQLAELEAAQGLELDNEPKGPCAGYRNLKAKKSERVIPRKMGMGALKLDLLEWEEDILRSLDVSDGDTAVRREWRDSVNGSNSIEQLRARVLSLELFLHYLVRLQRPPKKLKCRWMEQATSCNFVGDRVVAFGASTIFAMREKVSGERRGSVVAFFPADEVQMEKWRIEFEDGFVAIVGRKAVGLYRSYAIGGVKGPDEAKEDELEIEFENVHSQFIGSKEKFPLFYSNAKIRNFETSSKFELWPGSEMQGGWRREMSLAKTISEVGAGIVFLKLAAVDCNLGTTFEPKCEEKRSSHKTGQKSGNGSQGGRSIARREAAKFATAAMSNKRYLDSGSEDGAEREKRARIR